MKATLGQSDRLSGGGWGPGVALGRCDETIWPGVFGAKLNHTPSYDVTQLVSLALLQAVVPTQRLAGLVRYVHDVY